MPPRRAPSGRRRPRDNPASSSPDKLRGSPVSVTWSDGQLDASPSALAEVALLVDLGEQVAATPTGPSYAAALQPDYVAVATIAKALDRVDEIEGEVSADPTAELPPGAKG